MNKVFEQLKQEVYDNFSEKEIYKTPIIKNESLWETGLYKFFEKMPKAADLHIHGGAMMSVDCLIDFVEQSNEVLINTDKSNYSYLYLNNEEAPDTCMPLSKALEKNIFTKKQLTDIWTLKNCPGDKDVWDSFNDLFAMHTKLDATKFVCKDFYLHSLNYLCKQNIYHIEPRVFMMGSKKDAEDKLNCTFSAYQEVKKSYPQFSVRCIPVGVKHPMFDFSKTAEIYENAIYLSNKLKDIDDNFIVAIDMVNEEDSSRSLIKFEDIIINTLKKQPDFNLTLHAGETINTENKEIEIAVKLGASRIGHGLNLYEHPETKKKIIEKNICLEVCPASNHILGYCDDLREHPAINYFRDGIPIALCSDDPTYQEHSTLSDDFFITTLAWDLSLSDIEKLNLNSIKYSYLNSRNKENLFSFWSKSWNKFINKNLT